MSKRHIVFVPGKNPKPEADYHRDLLLRTLVEGVRRIAPEISKELIENEEDFKFIDWNYLYYQKHDDIDTHLPYVEDLFKLDGPSEEDIKQAQAWSHKLEMFIYNTVDSTPVLLRLLRGNLKEMAEETNRYFENNDRIASEIREQLKRVLRPMLADGGKVMVIGHSMGSVITYDTLWALSELEHLPGEVDTFLTLGSPLGMNYVQDRLLGSGYEGIHKYPNNIVNWVNVAAEGDLIALDRELVEDFGEMVALNMVESFTDHCDGVYNYFHGPDGLNCHRSYGYLINPVVSKVIADWWLKTTE
ncbi:MAG: hypothetical protein V7749_14970 [Cocleimonas sp.]